VYEKFNGATKWGKSLFAVSPQEVGLPTIVINELQFGLLRLFNPINTIDPTMRQLSTSEKERILSRLFWDVEINQIDVVNLLEQKLQSIDDIQSQQFFIRLLTSCDWYTLLKLMTPATLRMILTDPLLDKLFPKDLRQKYIYARKVLSRHAISSSGQSP
jgi:hypothetical protein